MYIFYFFIFIWANCKGIITHSSSPNLKKTSYQKRRLNDALNSLFLRLIYRLKPSRLNIIEHNRTFFLCFVNYLFYMIFFFNKIYLKKVFVFVFNFLSQSSIKELYFQISFLQLDLWKERHNFRTHKHQFIKKK